MGSPAERCPSQMRTASPPMEEGRVWLKNIPMNTRRRPVPKVTGACSARVMMPQRSVRPIS